MNLFSLFNHPPKSAPLPSQEHPPVDIEILQHNITEGGEFLDDALRMVEQPYKHTEESVAAGNPRAFF